MVGSRNPSAQGIKTAIEFAETLATAGYAITSGMALGIDAASHQGAINVNGHTIAVAGPVWIGFIRLVINNWQCKLSKRAH